MADLRVEVAGVSFKNPVIPASGAFGFGREYERFYPLFQIGRYLLQGNDFESERWQSAAPDCGDAGWDAQFSWSSESWNRRFY